jgi:DNA-binding NarL/FixJ family response regulator
VEATKELRRGREAYAVRAWRDAVEALTAADDQQSLGPEDLELLATALFMLGREEEYYAMLERAHREYLDARAERRAAYCAFWIGMSLFMAGEHGRGGGWLGRAHRLLEHEEDCSERGYLLMPESFQKEAAGDREGAVAAAAAAADAGRRFGDADLFALATHRLGELLIADGRVAEGLRLLDEAMLAAAKGELSPRPTGIVYCGAITGCRIAFDPRRAREWTEALHAWCELQPDLLAFTGDCHVHRAEVMQLHGAWDEALGELDRAEQRASRAGNARVLGETAYRRGEILRLRGDLTAAEDAYREAARAGREPQPGLASLRLAQGDVPAAVAAIRRMLGEATDAAQRAGLLAACVEIMLGADDVGAAREACAELDQIASDRPSEMLAAMAAHARGAIELTDGDPHEALASLRRALAGWRDLDARYEAARVRLLIARGCRALGDEDSAALDLDAAREALEALGAAVDGDRPRDAHGLTARELEVLRMVAAGATNKAIAAELVLSERTVDRHVSNIFAKLRVSSRAAATAYAYEHKLL